MSAQRWRWLRTLCRRLLRRASTERDLSTEMRFHFDQLVAEFRASGLSESDALSAARREFGAADLYREQCRDTWRPLALADLLRDLGFALRSLLRAPGFTALALLTLALGIGVNTAMFSLLNGLLLRPLSYPQSEELFRLDRTSVQRPFGDHAAANFLDIQAASAEVADLAAFRFWAFTLTEDGQPADVPNAVRVTTNFFPVLGKSLHLGRGFRADEGSPGRNNVVVISHRYWQTRFNSDPQVLGRSIRLDGEPVAIVGVLATDENLQRLGAQISLFRPLSLNEAQRQDRTDNSFAVFGRLHDGVSLEQAAARFDAIGQRLAADHPRENAERSLGVRSLQSTALMGTDRTTTLLLLGLSAFVLLIACANLANLLLARALARGREFAIRAALGASRQQLIRPLLAECLLLAAGGGAGAMLVAQWSSDWLAQRFSDPDIPLDFSVDGRVLAFALAASVLTAVLFGAAPAWWASRVGPNGALKAGARGSTTDRGHQRFRQVLIVTQFALALVLVSGAGFFVRGLDHLLNARTGWDPAPVISGTINLASGNYNAAEPIIAFHTEARDRLRALPGVVDAAVSFELPLYNAPASRNYHVEGREPPPPGQELTAFTNAVSPSFFNTVGMTLRRGRGITDADSLTAAPVVVINRTMATTLFPDGDALGQRLALAGTSDWAEIVGIVDDVRPLDVLARPIPFQVYKPFAQEAWQYVTLSVRAADPSLAPTLVPAIRHVIASLDPDQPVVNLLPTEDRIGRNLSGWDTINQLLIGFSGLGLLLSALGVYGVITRLVLQRTNEIGIRMALGATPRSVTTLVLGDGLRTALVGSALGLAGTWGLARFLNATLPAFGGSPLGPAALATGILFLIALGSCLHPARRATRINPVNALRAE